MKKERIGSEAAAVIRRAERERIDARSRCVNASTPVVGAVVGLALALTRGSEAEDALRKLNVARATGAPRRRGG